MPKIKQKDSGTSTVKHKKTEDAKESADTLTDLINEDENIVEAVNESRRQVRKGQLLTDEEVFGE